MLDQWKCDLNVWPHHHRSHRSSGGSGSAASSANSFDSMVLEGLRSHTDVLGLSGGSVDLNPLSFDYAVYYAVYHSPLNLSFSDTPMWIAYTSVYQYRTQFGSDFFHPGSPIWFTHSFCAATLQSCAASDQRGASERPGSPWSPRGSGLSCHFRLKRTTSPQSCNDSRKGSTETVLKIHDPIIRHSIIFKYSIDKNGIYSLTFIISR